MARSCCIWTPVLISISPITGESAKISRRRVILATSVGSSQVCARFFNESEAVEFRLSELLGIV